MDWWEYLRLMMRMRYEDRGIDSPRDVLAPDFNPLLRRLVPEGPEERVVSSPYFPGRPGSGPWYQRGVVNIDRQATPFMAAHELGHGLDAFVVNKFPKIPRKEKAFVRRKQLEAIRDGGYGELGELTKSSSLFNPLNWLQGIYTHTPRETRGSAWGSYLAFPDSVPTFSNWADSVVTANQLESEIAGVRKAIRNPKRDK